MPSLEGGFVELPYILEGRYTIFGGRSNEKQLRGSRFVYLEVTGPVRLYTLRAAQVG